MRRRDLNAITFTAVTIPLLFAGVLFVSRNALASVCITAAYVVLLFTRPRMIRVVRRLSGRGSYYDRGGYYED